MSSLTTALARRLPFFYGWVVVAVAFVTLGLGANSRSTFGLLFPPILQEFGWQRAETAFIFSAGFLAAAFVAPLIGYGMDRFGPRVVIPVGTLLVAAGFTAATFCTEIWQFFLALGFLVVTCSTSLSYNPHFILLPAWFERRRGLAIGIACTGVGVWAFVLFPWFQATIDEAGWRAACLALAGLMVAVLVPLNVLLQRRRPQDIGLNPDGDREPRVAAGALSASGLASSALPAASEDWTLRRALGSLKFWLLGAAFFCALFAWYAILVHQTRYLLDLGFSTQFSSLALGLVPLFGVVGQIGFGALSDRIAREWIWTFSCLGFAACYGLLILLRTVPDPLLVWVMAMAQGGLGYSIVSVYGAIPADMFRGRRYGLIFGCLQFFGSLGASIGPYVLGLVHDRTGSYDLAFAIAVALSLISIGLVWLAAPRRTRQR